MFPFLKRRRLPGFDVVEFFIKGCFISCGITIKPGSGQPGYYDITSGSQISESAAANMPQNRVGRMNKPGGKIYPIGEAEHNGLIGAQSRISAQESMDAQIALGEEQLATSRQSSNQQTLLGLLQFGLSKRMVTLEEQKYIDQERRAKEQDERATEMWNRYKELYLPGETAWVKESFAGIPVDQMLNRATADNQQAYDKAADQLGRNLSRMGINASSPKYTGLMSAVSRDQALGEVDSRNRSRLAVNDLNWERRRQATGMGQGMPMNASGITSQAASIMGTPGSMFSAAQSGLNSAAGMLQGASNTLAQGYNPLMNAYNTAYQGGLNTSSAVMGNLTSMSNAQLQADTARRGQNMQLVGSFLS